MKKSYTKLLLSIILDGIGFIPIPILSIIWAPISSFIMTKMYPSKLGKIAAAVSFIEELLPIDIFPSFTVMWLYTQILMKFKKSNIKK